MSPTVSETTRARLLKKHGLSIALGASVIALAALGSAARTLFGGPEPVGGHMDAAAWAKLASGTTESELRRLAPQIGREALMPDGSRRFEYTGPGGIYTIFVRDGRVVWLVPPPKELRK